MSLPRTLRTSPITHLQDIVVVLIVPSPIALRHKAGTSSRDILQDLLLAMHKHVVRVLLVDDLECKLVTGGNVLDEVDRTTTSGTDTADGLEVAQVKTRGSKRSLGDGRRSQSDR